MHIVNFLAKNLFKINGKYVSKKSISLKVSFCYGPRPWCPNSSKKWLKIIFALAGQQNDDDVGTAEFHENFFFFCENDCLFFCFVFSMFLEGQYSISRINLGILVYIKSRSWHIDTSTITIFKKKTFYFTMRCRKTQFNPLLVLWYH